MVLPPDDPDRMTNHADRLFKLSIFVILLAGGAMCIFSEWSAFRINGRFCFPLDDPWIHLQFARNLHDYGSFSYYKNEMVTSGSTSPLYTLLLSAGFFFTSNEFVLSYTLGIVFLLSSAFVLFKLSRSMFENKLIACCAPLLLLFEPRLEWAALSGMETTLFLLALLVAFESWPARRGTLLGISAGLAIWLRPDAILFLAVLAADALYRRYGVAAKPALKKGSGKTHPDMKWLARAGIITLAIGCAYAAFNFWLSGSVFPNTYAAKVKYYSGGGLDFPHQVLVYLTAGHLTIFSVFTAIGALSVLWSVLRRREEAFLIPLLWSAGLFLAYWRDLPYLYQEGRYLMPILPFVILLGLRGAETSLVAAKKYVRYFAKPVVAGAVAGLLLALFSVQFAIGSWGMKDQYAESCRYIGDRQVRTAGWIHDHLPAGSVIATHDVGAIAYYSGRRIVDMVGLVSPEMIDNIGSFDRLTQFLIRKKVTHLALLRNWFEVVNENSVFHTDELHPEIMEVFPFDPARTHFMPRGAGQLAQAATYYLSIGDTHNAGPLLERSLKMDPRSSKVHLLLGRAYLAVGKLDKAEAEVRAALRLHPQYREAVPVQAEIFLKTNRPEEAIATLEELVRGDTSDPAGYKMLSEVYRYLHDSLKALSYQERYDRILRDSTR